MVVRDRKLFDGQFWGGIGRIISVTGFSLVAGYLAVTLLPLNANDIGPIALGTKLLIITGIVFVTHVGISYIFALDEASTMLGAIKRFIFRPVRIEE